MRYTCADTSSSKILSWTACHSDLPNRQIQISLPRPSISPMLMLIVDSIRIDSDLTPFLHEVNLFITLSNDHEKID